MIGRTVHHYRIEAKLGESGTLWRAIDTFLGRSVALELRGARAGEDARLAPPRIDPELKGRHTRIP